MCKYKVGVLNFNSINISHCTFAGPVKKLQGKDNIPNSQLQGQGSHLGQAQPAEEEGGQGAGEVPTTSG